MAVIDLKHWIITEQKRIKIKILKGVKDKNLTRRSLHINHILSKFALIEACDHNLTLRSRSNILKLSQAYSTAKPFIFPPLK
jgi:hypothetical protein